jgi:glycosyltransferase involved in cell wall biosynthesis
MPDAIIKKPENVLIYISEPFPHGWAATNRVISYGTGFLYHQCKILVVVFRKTEYRDRIMNHDRQGVYRNIPFKYLAKDTIRSETFFWRRLDVIVQNFRLLIHAFRNVNQRSLVIYYSTRTSPAVILRFVTWINGGLFLKEESECPEIYCPEKPFLSRVMFKYLHYRLFDGLLLMTNFLKSYFREELQYKKPVLLVPMTVDLERFSFDSIQKHQKFTYCGMLNDEKDGIDILIKAFARISPVHPEFSLSLYGQALNDMELRRYQNMADGLGVSEKVLFHGRLDNDQIPKALSESSVLVLPRPASRQAMHGFPTKLGEYLATGNPVIVTPVGEIPLYLTNKSDVYFVAPGSIDELATVMLETIEDYGNSSVIGKNGQATANSRFNHIIQTKGILDFYNTFSQCAE